VIIAALENPINTNDDDQRETNLTPHK
jgi:hypothetical protein